MEASGSNKRKTKRFSEANSFLDLALSYFNPKFSGNVLYRRGIMIFYQPWLLPSPFNDIPMFHRPLTLSTNFLCFSPGTFLCLHSLQPWLRLNFANWTFYPSYFVILSLSWKELWGGFKPRQISVWTRTGDKLLTESRNVDAISQMQNQWSIQSSIREMKYLRVAWDITHMSSTSLYLDLYIHLIISHYLEHCLFPLITRLTFPDTEIG